MSAPLPPGPEQPAGDARTHTGDYYGVPLFLMRDYLARLGGVEAPDLHFAGAGWRAELAQAPWKQVGSLRVGGTTATFTGEPDVIEPLLDRLHTMTLRGGG